MIETFIDEWRKRDANNKKQGKKREMVLKNGFLAAVASICHLVAKCENMVFMAHNEIKFKSVIACTRSQMWERKTLSVGYMLICQTITKAKTNNWQLNGIAREKYECGMQPQYEITWYVVAVAVVGVDVYFVVVVVFPKNRSDRIGFNWLGLHGFRSTRQSNDYFIQIDKQ